MMHRIKEDPRIPVIRDLREDLEMTYSEIATYMGLHLTSVRNLYTHGRTTSATQAGVATRVRNGSHQSNRYSPYWTKKMCVEAGHRWIYEHKGNPPVSKDWEKNGPDRYWPSPTAIRRIFGSWSDFMLELGFFSQRGQQPERIV